MVPAHKERSKVGIFPLGGKTRFRNSPGDVSSIRKNRENMRKPDTPFYEELDHTADIGIRIRAESRQSLFALAALAMFDIMLAAFKPGAPEKTMEISVTASSPDLLLRELLAELLYMHMTQMAFVTGVHILELTDTMLSAQVTTIPMTDRMIADATEIKAVTYHGLSLLESESGFEAQIIFDT